MAGIADLHDRVKAVRHLRHAAVGFRRYPVVPGADGELAAVRHGFLRVKAEVEQHALKVRGIDAGVAEVGGEAQLHRHIFTRHAPDYLRNLADQDVEIDDLHLGLLPAAELKDLPGQSGRLEAGAVDFLQILHRGRCVLQFGRQDFAVAVDDREQVVEIVRHPAGQQAHGAEFL